MSTITRAEADLMALQFLRDEGPHTLPNPLNTEEAFAAAVLFHDLAARQLATCTDFGGGFVQVALTEEGRRLAG